jgi:tRNA threonylcarbamoyladenosine biosynthesis protein TsaB
MLILAVDTSSRHCSVALLRDLEVVAGTAGVTSEPFASRLFADVQSILSHSQIQLPQIELFAVAVGPGSFTGLRVGLAAVKGWAEALDRPIAPVSVLEAVACQVGSDHEYVAPVVDARGGHVFAGLYRRDESTGQLRRIGDEWVLSIGDCFEKLAEGTGGKTPVFVTTLPDVLRAGLAESRYAGARLEEASSNLAPFIGRLGVQRSHRGEVVSALGLEANYVRRSDAEMNWRGG